MNNISPEHEAELDRRFADSVPAPMVQVLPAEPGSVISAKLPGRKKAFLMALTTDGWWQRLDVPIVEKGPFRDVSVLFDAATPAASVPAADILALADEWKRLRKHDLGAATQKPTADAVHWCEKELRALVDAAGTPREVRLNCSPTEHAEDGFCVGQCAAAEQADKGEAADTPREGKPDHTPRCASHDSASDCDCAPAAPPEPLCRCGHGPDLHYKNGTCFGAYARGCPCTQFDPFSAVMTTDADPRVPVNDEAEVEPPAMVFLTDEERDYLAFHGVNLHTPPCEQCPEAQAAIESVLAARLAGFRAARGEDV